MSLEAKLQPIIMISAALLGMVLGRFTTLGNVSTVYIELFLMMLLYILFVCVDLKDVRKAFVNVKYTACNTNKLYHNAHCCLCFRADFLCGFYRNSDWTTHALGYPLHRLVLGFYKA